MRPYAPSILASAVALAACGEPPVTGEAPMAFATLLGRPDTAAVAGPVARLALAAEVEALGATAEGGVLVRAAGANWEVDAIGMEPRPLLATSGPEALGAVRSVAPRAAGGAWIAAQSGLFALTGAYVTHVAVPAGESPRSVADAPAGPLDGVWIAAGDGVYRWRAEGYDRLAVGSGGSSAVAVAPVAGAAVVDADGLVLVEPDGERLVREDAPFDLASFHLLVAGPDVLYAAGAGGVARWRREDSPRWTWFPLSAEASAPIAVDAVAVDPVSGVAWLRSDRDLLLITGDSVSRLVFLEILDVDLSSGAFIAVDRWGDVWLDAGAELLHLGSGSEAADVSFAADLAPWLGATCGSCHPTWTDFATFSARAEIALAKVRAGDMPRCGGGVPCAAEERLTADEYRILEAWIRGGKRP